MIFFVDVADSAEIRPLAARGLFGGVTTNPFLVAKTDEKFTDIIPGIRAIVPGPVRADAVATDYHGMMREAAVPRDIAQRARGVPGRLAQDGSDDRLR